MQKKSKQRRLFFSDLVFWLIFVLSLALGCAAIWVYRVFHVELAEIIFTIRAPLNGADSNFVSDALGTCLPPVLFGTVLFTLLQLFVRHWNRLPFRIRLRLWKREHFISGEKVLRWLPVAVSAGMLCMTCYYVQTTFNVVYFVKTNLSRTTIYEDYYTMPENAEIISPENPRNLLCIYLESMETTYSDQTHGGMQSENHIPYLTNLALSSISFGSSDTILGGARNLPNTAWTTSALMASTAGIPYSYPIDQSVLSTYSSFGEKLQNIGTVLDNKGYTQEFLCGSDAVFGGRQQYFSQHGNYRIYDYHTAIEQGDIPDDYYVWWGLEDHKLFDIAKKELTRLYAENAPFNLTMLTVDTHTEHGYICDYCDTEKYGGETLPTVLDCTDRQIQEFLDWCRQQPFYENTTIVLLGDHPRMDTDLVDGIPAENRKVYNCILNAAKTPALPTEGRIFTQLDMFPTVLSSMGFLIPDDRLGLGTDLFSSTPTLAEELGYAYLSTELQKQSVFYKENFY